MEVGGIMVVVLACFLACLILLFRVCGSGSGMVAKLEQARVHNCVG